VNAACCVGVILSLVASDTRFGQLSKLGGMRLTFQSVACVSLANSIMISLACFHHNSPTVFCWYYRAVAVTVVADDTAANVVSEYMHVSVALLLQIPKPCISS